MTLIYNSNGQEKISLLKKGGAHSLHVICDFDKTLTPAQYNGFKHQSTFAYLRNDNYLGEEYAKAAHKEFDTYHPYEIDPDISDELRKHKMKEWWTRHLNLKIKYGMRREIIEDLLAKKVIMLREGVRELFKELHKHNIPLLIFSAGIGSIIKAYLEQENLLTPNVHIISNTYIYDDNDQVIGYENNIVHSFNKNESHIIGTTFEQEIKSRPNTIIMGDSIGDAAMADSISHDIVLKIGLLNGDIAQLGRYRKVFDIVQTDDASIEEINTLIKEILG